MERNELEINASLREGLDRALLRRIATVASGVRPQLAAAVGATALATALRLAEPLLFLEILDQLIDGVEDGTLGSTSVEPLVALLFVVAVGHAVAVYAGQIASAQLGQTVRRRLESAVFDRLQRMPLGFFTRTQHGAVMTRMTSDLDDAQELFGTGVQATVSNVFLFVAGIGVLVNRDWRVAGALVTLLLLLLPARWTTAHVRSKARELYQQLAAFHVFLEERLGVSGALLVKLFGRPEGERAAFDRRSATTRQTVFVLRRWMARSSLVVTLGVALAMSVTVLLGSYFVVAGTMSLGTLVLFLFYIRMLSQPVAAFGDVRFVLVRGVVSFRRVFDVLDFEEPAAWAAGRRSLAVRGAVRFEDVRFSYPAAHEVGIASLDVGSASASASASMRLSESAVLNGVSFEVPAGGLVAVCGASGAGKSTIAMLLAGLYTPSGGRILLDDVDARDLSESSRRAAVAYVTQDTHLFHETIRENLRYASPGASDADIVRACRAAAVHDVVFSQPAGYNTVVGERGLRLSGGEKQRIAIARALLKDSPIVVLDEATAHLDPDAERHVQHTFNDVFSDRTRIVIAHRLSTIVDADRILVVDAGRIVEEGTHAELVDVTDGRYAALYRAQVAGEPAPA